MSRVEESGIAPWLLWYEVLRDVEAHWPNRVDRGIGVRRWNKEKFNVKL